MKQLNIIWNFSTWSGKLCRAAYAYHGFRPRCHRGFTDKFHLTRRFTLSYSQAIEKILLINPPLLTGESGGFACESRERTA